MMMTNLFVDPFTLSQIDTKYAGSSAAASPAAASSAPAAVASGASSANASSSATASPASVVVGASPPVGGPASVGAFFASAGGRASSGKARGTSVASATGPRLAEQPHPRFPIDQLRRPSLARGVSGIGSHTGPTPSLVPSRAPQYLQSLRTSSQTSSAALYPPSSSAKQRNTWPSAAISSAAAAMDVDAGPSGPSVGKRSHSSAVPQKDDGPSSSDDDDQEEGEDPEFEALCASVANCAVSLEDVNAKLDQALEAVGALYAILRSNPPNLSPAKTDS